MVQPANRHGTSDAIANLRTVAICIHCLLWAVAGTSGAEDPVPAPQWSPDSIWVVSTRNLSSALAYSNSMITPCALRNDEDEGWQRSSMDEFQQADAPGTVTLIYVHGNRFEWSDAIEYGRTARRVLVERRQERPPVRFVIWSWPSNQLRGLVRDVRVKADRADAEAAFLARFLADILPESQVSLMGSSFGARIITGALHLRAGGRYDGLVAPAAPEAAPVRVVLQAAAVDNDWLMPGHAHGLALTQTDAMLLLYNSCDPVLRRYRVLERCRHPQALGYTGARGLNCLDHFEQRDVCRVIGQTHRELAYYQARGLMSLASRYLLWEPVE